MDSTGAGGTFRDDELIMAVIEAAKALNGELRMTRRYAKGEVTEAEYDVMLAVEALQALEGGE